MNRKVLLLLTAAAALLLFVFVGGCSKETYDMAYITSGDRTDTKSAAYTCYKGVEEYASDSSLKLIAYNGTLGESVSSAVGSGVKVVIIYGDYSNNVVLQAAAANPTVDFYCIDFGHDRQVRANVYSIDVDERMAGFAAGYACVADGIKVMGIQSDDRSNSQEYAIGFISGAEYAAGQKKMKSSSVKIWYDVSGTDLEEARIDSWLNAGCGAIFCTAETSQTAYRIVSASDVVVIDQDNDTSDIYGASCTKYLSNIIYSALKEAEANGFMGGTAQIAGVEGKSCVFMPNARRFSVVAIEETNEIMGKLVDGEIVVDDIDVWSAAKKYVDLSVPGIIAKQTTPEAEE